MSKTVVLGLSVTNQEMYQEYREKLDPVLKEVGAKVILDVEVGNVRINPTETNFNRLIFIKFNNAESMKLLNEHPTYLSLKNSLFVPSVKQTVPLAKFDGS